MMFTDIPSTLACNLIAGEAGVASEENDVNSNFNKKSFTYLPWFMKILVLDFQEKCQFTHHAHFITFSHEIRELITHSFI